MVRLRVQAATAAEPRVWLCHGRGWFWRHTAPEGRGLMGDADTVGQTVIVVHARHRAASEIAYCRARIAALAAVMLAVAS